MPHIQITMAEGRSIEQKREIAKVITREIARIACTQENKVKIYFTDIKPENVSSGGQLRIDK
ncbi:MAG: tautomerase family protein [Peptococcales bacterium]